MSHPGFTAETSLYKTSTRYSGRISADSGSGGAMLDAWQFSSTTVYHPGTPVVLGLCGALGQACCRAPVQNLPAFGPVVGCAQGLGCDITTNTCVAAVGGVGQPCRDGPETRALKWTATGAIYSPTFMGARELCDAGACDKQSHRCFACGTQDGAPCCPPDAAQYTARCVGENLDCQFTSETSADSGICRRTCGKKGLVPCSWGCDPGLGVLSGLCDLCNAEMQPPCDNQACNPGLKPAQGLCRHCGDLGQIPCDSGGCNGTLKPRNNLCAVCGGNGQLTCDFTSCTYPYKPVAGVCRACGDSGQIPCGSLCNTGLVLSGGLCVKVVPGCATEGVGCAGRSCCAGLHCNTNQICEGCLQLGDTCSDNTQCCSGGCGVYHGKPHACTNCAVAHGDCSTNECCLDAGSCKWTITGARCELVSAACQDTGTVCRVPRAGGGVAEACCGENAPCPASNVCP